MQWHNALEPVFRVELGKEAENLTFEKEHQLSSKPLAMDMLVIKKEAGVTLEKNIARIFRQYNIVEYKSPKDYLNVNDFYKVYAYACLYQSDTKKVCEIMPSEITITFIGQHYPRKMMRYLEKERGLRAKKIEAGIYYLEGDEYAIQVLVTKELSKEENYWLSCLRDDLKSGGEIEEFVEKYEKNKKDKWYEDLADTIIHGNWQCVEEAKKMCQALRELFADELREADRNGESRGIAIGESRGFAIGQARALVLDNLESGVTKEIIIQKLQRFLGIGEDEAERYYQENRKEAAKNGIRIII